MPAPSIVRELVERFIAHRPTYQAGQYNEAQLREEFVNPLFEALGWDVFNRKGYADAYKEVIHEDAIRIGGRTKAPDYCFRAGGGTRSFFVEAKKPSVDIGEAVGPAFQLRRYAWSAKLPISVLTDFEEFAVYDCRIKPVKTDKAAVARVIYLKHSEYIERWKELFELFSPEAIRRGSFDRFLADKRIKKGTASVDAVFLQEMEAWRLDLAKNIALRNPGISQRDLNFAVQHTIDRIVFLRICEDRGIEPYGTLQSLPNAANIYRRLGELFQRADDRYNSGLFHFTPEKERPEPPDELTLSLRIDDKPLKELLQKLYFPESPYEFSVLPAEILGQVYEQFLGKVIRLTEGHRAKVEEKPEVRKAGGVYYTPSYIVDYIVAHTVGKRVGHSTPGQVSKLRILDPACGSGSFLLGAYQYLLTWHCDAYIADGAEKNARGRCPKLYRGVSGEWRLTTAEKKRILLNNIYGVDIDPQAVEVTKLSLLLKVLEGESGETITNQLRIFHERALPDLAGNIKCGNSLIGLDFLRGRQMSLLDDEERWRINVFDWKTEFPEAFRGRDAGFDAVIGNPPYVLLQDAFRDDAQLAYFRARFVTASYKLDTYHLFMEHAIRLLAPGGCCSMITPANYLTNNYLEPLRRFLLDKSAIDHIVVIDGGVFHGVSVDNAIFVAVGGRPSRKFPLVHAICAQEELQTIRETTISATTARKDEYALFTEAGDAKQTGLWNRIAAKSVLLGDIACVNFGKQLRDRKKYLKDVIKVDNLEDVPAKYAPCYTGRDVLRYRLSWGHLACLDDDVAQCGGCWDSEKQNAKNKLITRQIGRFPEFAIDTLGYQCLNTVFMINLKEKVASPLFLLGILNSRLLRVFWLQRFYDQRRTFPKIKGTYLKQLPIPQLAGDEAVDQSQRDRMTRLVETILKLHERLPAARTAHDRTVVERQIAATDQQIDLLVYELYELTDEDIKIVEAS
jgi:predicted type IV restriction endonuclease